MPVLPCALSLFVHEVPPYGIGNRTVHIASAQVLDGGRRQTISQAPPTQAGAIFSSVSSVASRIWV